MTTATPDAPQIAPKQDRHTSIDTLRGFAVLGILMMNIQAFAMVFPAYVWPPAQMDITGANLDVWFYSHVFFAMKAMTTFSALFGAGIVLMLGEDKEAKLGLHYRRMIWLLVIGLIHAWIFWSGDILVPYAVMGMLVVFARRMSVPGLLILGTILVIVGGALMALIFVAIPFMPEDQLQAAFTPTPDMVAETVATYREGFLARLPLNMGLAMQNEIGQITFFAPRLAGAMLIGMALYKNGFLTLKWSSTKYLIAAVIALGIGLPATWMATLHHVETGFAIEELWLGETANYFLSPIVAFGYAAVIMFLCKIGFVRILLYPFTAAGRMAFTNYLSQTLIMTFLFVGPPGLGWFGTMERVEQAQLVFMVWAAQLIISPVWLHFFRFGPLEWVWRSLSYWKIQPILKTRDSAPAAAPPGG